MSVRVHEIAKELKLSSKEVLDKLKSLKIDAKNHMSTLTEDNVKRLTESFKKAETPKVASAAPLSKPPAQPASSGKVSQPSSIESVKKELLLQRIGMKATQAAAQAKKTTVETASRPLQTVRPAPAPAAPIRPKHEPKKVFKPAEPAPAPRIEEAAAVSGVADGRRIKKIQMEGSAIAVKDLAVKLSARPSDLIQRLIKLGIFANINQPVNFEIASKIAAELGCELEKQAAVEAPEEEIRTAMVDKSLLATRAPIVTFMGHVDHGKTSLLDAIRNTKVAAKEAGGITQHIGAYEVFLPKGAVTFLDTPGHEAFTSMRARGAKVTDVVVLVVAADDGVMPQTVEAIDHAKAAGVPIIVAINKMDLPSANPDRVKKGLMEHGLMAEEWGGKTIMVGVSAKSGKGIDELLEMLVLESDLLELKANPSGPASGVVVEASMSKESGVQATLLVQDGTLRVGDVVVAGAHYCKVRAMINDRGQRIKEAPPSMPVMILGLSEVPRAGDKFEAVQDEHRAKEIAEARQKNLKEKGPGGGMEHVTLEHLFEEVKSGKVKELKLVIKSDVQGSVEALASTLGKIQAKNVGLNIIHSGVGDVSESDILLAAASNAVVIGFHVGISEAARGAAEKELVDVRFYEIIYEVKTAIEKAMEGLLQPELKEVFVGAAEVRQVFKISKVGTVAGCSVQKGKIVRNFSCRVVRNGAKIHEGKVQTLKRFKDDAREVLEGFECGIGVSGFEDLVAGDRIEVFEIQKQARKLE